MIVLRSMIADEDGLPKTGKLGRYLGARPTGRNRDIPVSEDGMVRPGTGGMSVSPPPMKNLPDHRRPVELGGESTDPVFEIDTDELPPELTYRPDPEKPEEHGFIEPAREMSFEEYQRALHETRGLWRRVR